MKTNDLAEQGPSQGRVLVSSSLCNLNVLCGSVVSVCHVRFTIGDTEATEDAQRSLVVT
jgi:hypothetical protein